MSEELSGSAAGEILLPLPIASELPGLRSKVKRVKLPVLPAGTHWGNSIVGSYTTSASNDGVIVNWKTIEGPERSESFDKLGTDPSLEAERLELGWMIANMLRIEALRMLQTIPGPMEAMAESDRYSKEEERWRMWALLGVQKANKK